MPVLEVWKRTRSLYLPNIRMLWADAKRSIEAVVTADKR